MSIILDALKKADEKKNPAESGTAPNSGPGSPDTGSKKLGLFGGKSPFGAKLDLKDLKANKRVVVLGGVVLVLLLAVVIFGNPLTALMGGGGAQPAVVTNQPSPQDLTSQLVEKQVQENLENVKKLRGSAIQNFKEGNLQETLQAYAKLSNTLGASDDPEIYNNYGVALRKSGQLEEAKGAYEKALALKPDYPEALNNLAVVHMTENRYHKAKELLLRAIEVDPDYVDPYFHLAISLEKNGQVEEAIKYYDKFLEISVDKVSRTVRLQVEERLSKLKQ